MIDVDAHIEADAAITGEAGHDVAARQRVLQRHRVLILMTHVDPWRRPDLDHAAVAPQRLQDCAISGAEGEMKARCGQFLSIQINFSLFCL